MDITQNLTINSSPEKVYKAVSTREGITGWWAKQGEVGEAVGENSNLTFDKQGQIVKMGFRTEELEPNSKVVWRCIENGNPAWLETTIEFDLSSSDEGTELKFAHAGFDEKWEGQPPFTMTKETWGAFMASLKSYCEEGVGQPW